MHAGNHSAWPKDKRMTGHNHSGASLATQDRLRWRRDSNPRDPFEPNGFQDRRFQPLTHSSVSNSNVSHAWLRAPFPDNQGTYSCGGVFELVLPAATEAEARSRAFQKLPRN